MTVKSLKDLDLRQKRVLVRVDYNVPLSDDGAIGDDSRIKASLPTLAYLLERDCRITLMSHLGRPDGKPDPAYSMAPVARHLSALLGRRVSLVAEFGDGGQHGPIQLLENLRFTPGETANDAAFARQLAAYGEVYVNDAFGAAHRAHASIDAVTRLFEHKCAGLLMEKELHYLREALRQPARPFLAIMGGSKISDKLKVIKSLLEKVDQLMIGGGMSYTFLKSRGIAIGKSLLEADFLEEARQIDAICTERGIELLLPTDHVTAMSFSAEADAEITLDESIEPGYMGLDIGPETINRFVTKILAAKTVVWNGPMGVFEWEAFSTGTVSVAEAMAESEALTVVGGGDSVAAVNMAEVADAIDHISTGGGASLELLAGLDLPGIIALES